MGNRTVTKKVSAGAKHTKKTLDETLIRHLIDGWAKALRGFIYFSLAPANPWDGKTKNKRDVHKFINYFREKGTVLVREFGINPGASYESTGRGC